MSKSPIVKRVSRFLLAGAVLGGLAFGASTLVARDIEDCDGYTESDAACKSLCLQLYPLNNGVHVWHPSTGCCICATR